MIEPCIKNTVPLSIPICSFNNNVEVERPELNEVHLPQCLNVGDHRLAREEERATRSLDGSSLPRRVPVFGYSIVVCSRLSVHPMVVADRLAGPSPRRLGRKNMSVRKLVRDSVRKSVSE